LTVYGVDILVEEGTGKHLIVDCNFFGSYGGISEKDIMLRFDEMATILTKNWQPRPKKAVKP